MKEKCAWVPLGVVKRRPATKITRQNILLVLENCFFSSFRLARIDIQSDFVLQPTKSRFNTVRLVQVQTHCFSRQAHGATLGHIFFNVWSQKLANSGNSFRVLWKIHTRGPLGNQTFPRGCALRESLITLGISRSANFCRQPLQTFHCLYQTRGGRLCEFTTKIYSINYLKSSQRQSGFVRACRHKMFFFWFVEKYITVQ